MESKIFEAIGILGDLRTNGEDVYLDAELKKATKLLQDIDNSIIACPACRAMHKFHTSYRRGHDLDNP